MLTLFDVIAPLGTKGLREYRFCDNQQEGRLDLAGPSAECRAYRNSMRDQLTRETLIEARAMSRCQWLGLPKARMLSPAAVT